MLSPLAKIQPGGDKTQRERSRPDERDFLRLAMQQLRPELARVVQAVQDEGFLISQRAALGAFGNGFGDAMRQRANPGVREENFVAGDGEFMLAKFLVREQFGQCHAAKVIGKGPARKAELKSFQNIGKFTVWTVDASPELDDLVGDHQRDQHINEPRHPGGEGVQLARAVLIVKPAQMAERFIQFAADFAAGIKIGEGFREQRAAAHGFGRHLAGDHAAVSRRRRRGAGRASRWRWRPGPRPRRC